MPIHTDDQLCEVRDLTLIRNYTQTQLEVITDLDLREQLATVMDAINRQMRRVQEHHQLPKPAQE